MRVRKLRAVPFSIVAAVALIGSLAGAEPDQTAWRALLDRNDLNPPVLGNGPDDVVYAFAIANNGDVLYATSTDPFRWYGWTHLDGVVDPATGTKTLGFKADPNTPPALAETTLVVRGQDKNLYCMRRQGDTWIGWHQITSDGAVGPGISIAYAFLKAHVLYTRMGGSSSKPMLAYQPLDGSYNPDGGPFTTAGTRGSIGSTLVHLLAVTVPVSARGLQLHTLKLLPEEGNEWSDKWSDVTPPNLSQFNDPTARVVDVSNVVHFAESYHFTYTTQERWTGSTTSPLTPVLHHVRFEPPAKYQEQVIDVGLAGTTPQKAALHVYRNKLVVVYKDHNYGIRLSYWDTADPRTPWIGQYDIGIATTEARPSVTVIDTGLPIPDERYLSARPQYGHDLVAAVLNSADGKPAYVNASRAAMARHLDRIGLEPVYTFDDPPSTAAAYGNDIYLVQMDRGRNYRIVPRSSIALGGAGAPAKAVTPAVPETALGLLGGGLSIDLGMGPESIPTPGPPAVVSHDGALHVFITHWDNRVYTKKTTNPRNWPSEWTEVVGPQATPEAHLQATAFKSSAAAAFNDEIHLVTVNNTGPALTAYTSGDWSTPEIMPEVPAGHYVAGSAPPDPRGGSGTLVAFDGRLHFFTRVVQKRTAAQGGGATFLLWHITSDTNGDWTGAAWADTGLETPTAPACVEFNGKLYVFACNVDGFIEFGTLAPNANGQYDWSGWTMVPGQGAGMPLKPIVKPTPNGWEFLGWQDPRQRAIIGPATAVLDGTLHVFSRDENFTLRECTTTDGVTWSGWNRTKATAETLIGSHTRDPKQLPIFTDIGFVTWRVPHAFMSDGIGKYIRGKPATELAFGEDQLKRRASWYQSEAKHRLANRDGIPAFINFNHTGRFWNGPHGRFTSRFDDEAEWFHELGHMFCGMLGIGVPTGPPSPLPDGLFAGKPELAPKVIDRPRGYTGQYTSGAQHDWIDVLIHYTSNGYQLRYWARIDAQQGYEQLQRKYDWMKAEMFQGTEFGWAGEPYKLEFQP